MARPESTTPHQVPTLEPDFPSHQLIRIPMDKSAPESQQPAPKVKPCCVCKPEKATRDECLLFHGQDSPECKTIIENYKACMKGYGFAV